MAGAEEQKGDGANQIKAAEAARKQPEEQLQQGLKGVPKMAGLSSYEYTMTDGAVRYHCAEPKPENLDEPTIQRYRKLIHYLNNPLF